MTTLQSKMGFQDADLKTPMHDKIMLWVQDHAAQIIWAATRKEVRPSRQSDIKTSPARWEQPVTAKNNGYTIGFVDMVLCGDWPFPRTAAELADHWSPTESAVVAVEVKTTIPNVGELLRQINLYRANFKETRSFVVVSPDDRFAGVICSQGIAFIKYEQEPMDEAMQ